MATFLSFILDNLLHTQKAGTNHCRTTLMFFAQLENAVIGVAFRMPISPRAMSYMRLPGRELGGKVGRVLCEDVPEVSQVLRFHCRNKPSQAKTIQSNLGTTLKNTSTQNIPIVRNYQEIYSGVEHFYLRICYPYPEPITRYLYYLTSEYEALLTSAMMIVAAGSRLNAENSFEFYCWNEFNQMRFTFEGARWKSSYLSSLLVLVVMFGLLKDIP
ncbi:PREDICTED: uncharacterized protein LOC106726634 [Myotis brandtii]|uniref:uncharacterized protein LOC106726634 n=1 Tax=Myotis brandtii TaxID=109478 RepID=UPI00070401E4|nr:PREDICTED: uncharacterized protein LOC106726634 [Myotis brandtii]